MVIDDDPALVAAIHRNDLVSSAADSAAPWASEATATTTRIGDRVGEIADEVHDALARRGLDVMRPDAGARQRHAVDVSVDDPAAADLAAEALRGQGFERWERWSGGAAESYRRHAGHLTVARTRDVTEVVRVVWRAERSRTRWQRLFGPTEGDWSAVALPERLWWLYPLVRPVRLLAERTGFRRRFAASMGPFLSTSESLIDPLFDVAEIDATDRVADLGCGDGRLVVAAAHRGARAIGVDRDAALVDRGRVAAIESGVADRVELVVGDARDLDLRDVTVVLVFLPVDVLATILDDLLERLPAGSCVVAHEQHELPADIRRPDRSVAILAGDAVTVAHRWHAVEQGQVGGSGRPRG